jgi:hypothetical protein
MATTATDTMAAAIDSYLDNDADEVLKQFHTNAKIRGTKKKDKWEKKSHAKSQITTDMAAYTVSGPFANSVIEPHELNSLADGVMLFERNGSVTFKRKNNKKQLTADARWTAILKEYSDGWKITYSHFSLEEGKSLP